VPASWKNFTSSPAPCGSSKAPVVGRFSPWLTLQHSGCAVAVLPLAERHEYVWFDDVQQPGIKKYDGGWTEETREVAGVHVSVLTKDDALRERILQSAAPLTGTADAYGCEQNGYLPSGDEDATGLTQGLGKVTSVDICEYWGARSSKQSSLIAGSSLDGSQATRLARQVTTEVKTARTTRQGTTFCLPAGQKTIRLTLNTADGNWPLLFEQLDCTNEYGLQVGSQLRRFSITFTDLLFTGVHHPEQASDLIEVPGSFTPPPR
jgi:hypothetical protein